MKLLRLKALALLFLIPVIMPGCSKSGCPVNQALYNEYRGVTKKEAKKEQRGTNSLGMKAPSKVAEKNRKKGGKKSGKKR